MFPASLHRRCLQPGVPVYRFSGRKTYRTSLLLLHSEALQEETRPVTLRTIPVAMVAGISTSIGTGMGMKAATLRIDQSDNPMICNSLTKGAVCLDLKERRWVAIILNNYWDKAVCRRSILPMTIL